MIITTTEHCCIFLVIMTLYQTLQGVLYTDSERLFEDIKNIIDLKNVHPKVKWLNIGILYIAK